MILAHERRRVLHFNVTEHPTAEWTAQQIIEAFPEDVMPQYLIRDRDGVYGSHFRNRVQGMGIHEEPTQRMGFGRDRLSGRDAVSRFADRDHSFADVVAI